MKKLSIEREFEIEQHHGVNQDMLSACRSNP
jgi:hypothetical protein